MSTVQQVTLPMSDSLHTLALDDAKKIVTQPSEDDLRAFAEKGRGIIGDDQEAGPIVIKAPGDDDFPDGGLRAWLVVLGAFCNAFATVGYVTSWGIFQEYYEKTLLSEYSPSTISWIGSIQYALIFFPGLVVGRLFDLGYFRYVFIFSSSLLIATTFLAAQCTEYWQFLLCQGIASGIGCGGVFSPTHAILSHWFKKKRGLVLGYMAVGASVGGVILPIAAHKLIPEVGFRWAMRIIGFILVVVLGVSNLTVRRRLPPKKIKGGLLNLSAFKELPYTMYCISSFFIFLGLYTLLIFANVSASSLGIEPELASYFVALANAGSLFGRYVSGILSDRIGPMNVMIPFTLLAAAFTYGWPFTHTTAQLIVITLIYGFCSGMYVSLMTNPIMNLGGEEDIGRRIGMFMSILAIGALCGPPISGAIQASTGSFQMTGVFAGTVVIVGVIFMAITRLLVSTKLTAKL
ncbi:hypothetical protein D9756_010137 [Leucocoprinus leucothites]|uniref:Major facilitator superfamily (MFS) profile domain-containing protein n=1 Tax=Leucocoprinus leucothites TaxID=201217 RepID=A0A8H5CU27_9AGAR|nr:hypothetical protein D9756_010137 [Leucoagaricus leucothites]